MVRNSFSFYLSGKLFLSLSILNGNLGWKFFFQHLNILYLLLLACKVFAEKSADGLLGGSLICNKLFFYCVLKILTFDILIIMCFAVVSLGSSYLDSLGFLDLDVCFLLKVKKVFTHFLLQVSLLPLSPFLLFLGTSVTWMLVCLMLSHRSQAIFTFYISFFSLLLYLGEFTALSSTSLVLLSASSSLLLNPSSVWNFLGLLSYCILQLSGEVGIEEEPTSHPCEWAPFRWFQLQLSL